MTPEERFWSKVDKSGGSDACWPWMAARWNTGYGGFQFANTSNRTHRVAFAIATYGDIFGLLEMKGVHVLHKCDNPPCCNPRHLYAGTPAQNTADMLARGRQRKQGNPSHIQVRGERHGLAVLTKGKVLIIKKRLLRGDSISAIARSFDVHRGTIRFIRQGKTWRHVSL